MGGSRVRRPRVSWALRRDLLEYLQAEDDAVRLLISRASDEISVFPAADGWILEMSRPTARLLAKRISQCLDSSTREAIRQAARDRRASGG